MLFLLSMLKTVVLLLYFCGTCDQYFENLFFNII